MEIIAAEKKKEKEKKEKEKKGYNLLFKNVGILLLVCIFSCLKPWKSIFKFLQKLPWREILNL